MQENIIMILCGVLAVIFQCLVKLDSLKKDARVANVHFNWIRDYVNIDSIQIVMSFMAVAIYYLVYQEVIAKFPWLEQGLRLSFVLIGGIGSWLIQYFFGSAKKRIRAAVDAKTDELDKLTNRTEKTTLPEKP